MNEPKAYDAAPASGTGIKSVLSDPLALATKPAVIFKFASAVSNEIRMKKATNFASLQLLIIYFNPKNL